MDDRTLKGELEILTRFIQVYCNGNHGTKRKQLCPECSGLLAYATGRLEHCPYDPKPACKACPTHCYKPEMRKKIKEVMRYSGIHFVKRGRVDWLIKYFMQG
jgi:hypothetical protein